MPQNPNAPSLLEYRHLAAAARTSTVGLTVYPTSCVSESAMLELYLNFALQGEFGVRRTRGPRLRAAAGSEPRYRRLFTRKRWNGLSFGLVTIKNAILRASRINIISTNHKASPQYTALPSSKLWKTALLGLRRQKPSHSKLMLHLILQQDLERSSSKILQWPWYVTVSCIFGVVTDMFRQNHIDWKIQYAFLINNYQLID